MLNKAGILTEPMEWLWKNKTVNLHSQLQKSRVNVALHISINCEGHHIKLKDLNKLSEITQMISRCSQFSQKDYTKSVHQALKKKKIQENSKYCILLTFLFSFFQEFLQAVLYAESGSHYKGNFGRNIFPFTFNSSENLHLSSKHSSHL